MNRVNMLLTEIALNLLGNKFYNVDGNPVENLVSLFKLDESEQSISANEKHLKDVLGLTSCQTNQSSLPDSDDDDVVHVEIPQQVITLDDDEPENEEISTSHERRSNQSSSRSASSSCIILEPSTSAELTQKTIDDEDYSSPNANRRLNYFRKAVKLEYESMLKNSEVQKADYIKTYQHLMTILKLSENDLIQRFHSEQKNQLYAEIQTLMQFIRIVKTTDKTNEEIISQVAKDILLAKSNILN